MSFGERLTRLRKSKGLSQEQLAEKLNITRQTVSKWELEQSTPDIDYLVALSDYFEVSTDYLVKGEPSTTPKSEKVHPQNNRFHKRCFYLGLAMLGICFIGTLVFVIPFVLPPVTTVKNNRAYTGLLGFLIGMQSIWFFRLLPVMNICGWALTIYGIVKKPKAKK